MEDVSRLQRTSSRPRNKKYSGLQRTSSRTGSPPLHHGAHLRRQEAHLWPNKAHLWQFCQDWQKLKALKLEAFLKPRRSSLQPTKEIKPTFGQRWKPTFGRKTIKAHLRRQEAHLCTMVPTKGQIKPSGSLEDCQTIKSLPLHPRSLEDVLCSSRRCSLQFSKMFFAASKTVFFAGPGRPSGLEARSLEAFIWAQI